MQSAQEQLAAEWIQSKIGLVAKGNCKAERKSFRKANKIHAYPQQ